MSWLPGMASSLARPAGRRTRVRRLNWACVARCVMSPVSSSTSGRSSAAKRSSAATTSGRSVPKCGSETCSSTVIGHSLGRRPGRADQIAAAPARLEHDRQRQPADLTVGRHLHAAHAEQPRRRHGQAPEREAEHLVRLAEAAERAAQQQPEQRERPTGRSVIAASSPASMAGRRPRRSARAAAGCCRRTASACAGRVRWPSASMRTRSAPVAAQQRDERRRQARRAGCGPAPLQRLAVLEQLRVQAEARVDQEHAPVDQPHLHRLRARRAAASAASAVSDGMPCVRLK